MVAWEGCCGVTLWDRVGVKEDVDVFNMDYGHPQRALTPSASCVPGIRHSVLFLENLPILR